jgi:hypothetical protein
MIRDEADIIAPFLRHLAAFFDIAFLLDQRSSDGTSALMQEACIGREGWTYHFMDFAGRHQKEVNTHFMAEAFGRGADVLFFIDSDEFVAFCDKPSLVDAVSSASTAPASLAFRFRPCLPQRFDRWQFEPDETLWIGRPNESASVPGATVKVAIPRSLFKIEPRMRMTQGNHSAFSAKGHLLPATPVGSFYHVPIRSKQQFIQKVFLSSIANFAKHNPMTEEGVHKRRLLEAIAEREISDEALASFAAQYPPTRGLDFWESPIRLEQRGFELGRLETSFADLRLADLPEPSFHQVLARSLTEYASEDLEAGGGTLVFEPGVVRFQPAPERWTRVLGRKARTRLRGLARKAVMRWRWHSG